MYSSTGMCTCTCSGLPASPGVCLICGCLKYVCMYVRRQLLFSSGRKFQLAQRSTQHPTTPGHPTQTKPRLRCATARAAGHEHKTQKHIHYRPKREPQLERDSINWKIMSMQHNLERTEAKKVWSLFTTPRTILTLLRSNCLRTSLLTPLCIAYFLAGVYFCCLSQHILCLKGVCRTRERDVNNACPTLRYYHQLAVVIALLFLFSHVCVCFIALLVKQLIKKKGHKSAVPKDNGGEPKDKKEAPAACSR